MKKQFGLGRGLESLIPTKAATNSPAGSKVKAQAQENVYYVEVNKLRPNANQPRRDFDKDALKELAASIKKYGILQPLLVSKVEIDNDRGRDVQYEIIAGERRWRAAQIANLPHVPVIVKDQFDEKRVKLEVALVENIQRTDLGALEEADAYLKLHRDFGLSHDQIAAKVGKARPVITNAIRLLALPANIKEALRSGRIVKSHARALLAFKDPTLQKATFKKILAGNFSSGEVEQVAKESAPGQRNGAPVNPRFAELEQNLTKNLGTAVFIKAGSAGGSIRIKFGDLEQLNKIAKTILD